VADRARRDRVVRDREARRLLGRRAAFRLGQPHGARDRRVDERARLMELIVLDIGLQAGIIGPALFSMPVLMTTVTTLMAGRSSSSCTAATRVDPQSPAPPSRPA
jgi:hypothetical protein